MIRTFALAALCLHLAGGSAKAQAIVVVEAAPLPSALEGSSFADPVSPEWESYFSSPEFADQAVSAECKPEIRSIVEAVSQEPSGPKAAVLAASFARAGYATPERVRLKESQPAGRGTTLKLAAFVARMNLHDLVVALGVDVLNEGRDPEEASQALAALKYLQRHGVEEAYAVDLKNHFEPKELEILTEKRAQDATESPEDARN